MTCPSAVTHSMYADGALPAREARMLELHAQMCAECAMRIDALSTESAVLRSALRYVDDAEPIPRFVPPPRARDFVVLVASVLLIGGFSKAFWSTVASALPSELGWFNPLISGALYDRAVSFMTFIIFEGSAMWTAVLNFVGAALVVAFASWLAFAAVRRHAFGGIAAAALTVVAALPSIGHAFEIRHNEGGLVAVAPGDTVDDTLLAMGSLVTIDGTVNGDLLAFAEEVTVRGTVAGNLVTAARLVTIEGTVGGSVLGAAENVSLADGRIGGDFYGFGNTLKIAPEAGVTGNAIAFAQSADLGGSVGADFKGFGNSITVSGTVEGDLDGFGASIRLLPTARVSGNVTARVDSAGDLEVAPGAVVGGAVDERIVEQRGRRDGYSNVGYYFAQVVRLAGAFLTGLLLLWLFPVLRNVSLPNATAVVRSGAIGLAAAVTLPVAALIVCLTVIGIPLGLLTFLLGAIGLYFSKTVVAQIIGRAVLRNQANPPHFAMTLLVGLVIVIVAINLPWIGGIANFVVTLVGFGIIVSLVLARFNRETPV